MSRLNRLRFGDITFEASEEHLEFQYTFLYIVIRVGALLTGLLIPGSHSAVNRIAPAHVHSMSLFTPGSMVCWLALRGRKSWFLQVAWPYEPLCMLEYLSAGYYRTCAPVLQP